MIEMSDRPSGQKRGVAYLIRIQLLISFPMSKIRSYPTKIGLFEQVKQEELSNQLIQEVNIIDCEEVDWTPTSTAG